MTEAFLIWNYCGSHYISLVNYLSFLRVCSHERRNELIAGAFLLQSFWQKWNFISGDKISCQHYPKSNAYTSPSKYRVVLKCSRNETSCERNLFSRQTNMSSFRLSCERTLIQLIKSWYYWLSQALILEIIKYHQTYWKQEHSGYASFNDNTIAAHLKLDTSRWR